MHQIAYYALSAFAVLITLTVHEYSHGYVAYKLGDPTAKNYGRLTLNPIKHIDPIGAICMVFFHIGWAKPVPINPAYFKKPKRDFAISALAGPLSNIILAFLSAFLYLSMLSIFRTTEFTNEFLFNVVQNTVDFLFILHSVNIGIAVFNLIPLPPLDGSRILAALLPEKIYFKIMEYERTVYLVFLAFLLGGGIVSDILLKIPLVQNNPVLAFIAGLLDITGMLSALIREISKLIIGLLSLIPFLN